MLAYQDATSVVDNYSIGHVNLPLDAAASVMPRLVVSQLIGQQPIGLPLPPPKPPLLSTVRSVLIAAAIGGTVDRRDRIHIDFDDTSATLDVE